MRAAEGSLRLLYHAPLLGAALLLPGSLASPPAAGLAFAVAAAYARTAALASGASALEEALLLAETLPYLAYCAVFAGGARSGAALLSLAECAVAGAALLLAEFLVLDEERRARLDGLGRAAAATVFAIAAALCGIAMALTPAAAFLGAAAAVGLLCAYAIRRRP